MCPRHRGPARAEGEVKRHSVGAWLTATALLGGCASAGGTAGIFDTGSVWYKHPTTENVKECSGFSPGAQMRQDNCGQALQAQGYVEVEKCAKAPAYTECVTDGEIAAVKEAEALEQGLPPAFLWRPALDSTGQRVPDRWFPIRGFDSRAECEAELRRAITPSLLCLPDTVPGEELHRPRLWVLWRARLDDALQPIPDQWLLTQGYDSRRLCELSRDWEREFERRSPELWRELERQRERDLERDMERTFGPERWPEVRRDLERKLGREFLRIPPPSLLCLPHTIDPNTPKGK